MNKLLIFLITLCVTSLEAATITNWGAQLTTMAPASGDAILMQKGGVTYYFTPVQLATFISTNLSLGTSNAIPNLNGRGTNATFAATIGVATNLWQLLGTNGLPLVFVTSNQVMIVSNTLVVSARPQSTTTVPLTIAGSQGQDANLFNVKDYLGNVLFAISYDGTFANPRLGPSSMPGALWTATDDIGNGDWSTNLTPQNLSVSNVLASKALIINANKQVTNAATSSAALDNFFAMGITNVLGSDGIALATNNGALWITNTTKLFSIAQMTNLTVGLSEGSVVDVSVRASIGDKGGGTFRLTQTVQVPDNGIRFALSTAGWYAVRQWTGPVLPQWFGALADGTDQTTKVQAALSALAGTDNEVHVGPGFKFNLSALVFPTNSYLGYYRISETSTNFGGNRDSQEYVLHMANKSYTSGVGGGVVNEFNIEAAFHPGLLINLRKNLTGHTQYLSAVQAVSSPKASLVIVDEMSDAVLMQYSNWWSNNVDGFRISMNLPIVTLSGLTSASFATPPLTNEIITGTTSQAKGRVREISGSVLKVLWVTGVFATGETVADTNETTSATISGTATTVLNNDGLYFDRNKHGHAAIGLLNAPFPLSVGGTLGVFPTHNFSQASAGTVTNPRLVFANDSTAALSTTQALILNIATGVLGIKGAGHVSVGGEAVYNPGSWGKVLQVTNSASNGSALSLVDSTREFNIASYGGQLYVTEQTTARLTLNASGNFGIGTDPTNRLDVAGHASIRSNLYAASVFITGTTNQVMFGATNIAPSSAVAPTKWVSVRVSGDAGVYRLPLYE